MATIFRQKGRKGYAGEISLGVDRNGDRIRKRAYGRTEGEVKDKLDEIRMRYKSGLSLDNRYTMAQAVADYVAHKGHTSTKQLWKAERVSAGLGHYTLLTHSKQPLTAYAALEWLREIATEMSTSSVRELHSYASAVMRHAHALGNAERNIFDAVDAPKGLAKGRPSKSLTLSQLDEVLRAAYSNPQMYAYIVLAATTGVRTEEQRALKWSDYYPDEDTPYIAYWASVRADGDTKTQKSRRSLALPGIAVAALNRYRETAPDEGPFIWGGKTKWGNNKAKMRFRKVLSATSLTPDEWTPRELRHTFVSVLSDSGMPSSDIALLTGHSNTNVTETVYRKRIRPVVARGAERMDEILGYQFGYHD